MANRPPAEPSYSVGMTSTEPGVSGDTQLRDDFQEVLERVAGALRDAALKEASDVLFVIDSSPWIRVGGDFGPAHEEFHLHHSVVQALCQRIVEDAARAGLDSIVINSGGAKWRATAFDTLNGPRAAFRRINEHPPELEVLGLPEEVRPLAQLRSGLVIVSGETGSGKTTTSASIIETINTTRNVHILTIEDPTEFSFVAKESLISQRNIPEKKQEKALELALRSAPDVIFFGECRTNKHIRQCLTAANTGHLVITTLHARDAGTTLNRILSLDKGGEVRSMLSQALRAIISQCLIERAHNPMSRVLAAEVCLVDPAIRRHIYKGEVDRIVNRLRDRFVGLDSTLASLVGADLVERETARTVALDATHFDNLVGGGGT